MSSSSQRFGGDNSENDDLYELLNVHRDVNASELKSAYRQLSQRFHPDKHVDLEAKAKANDHFTRVKEAYEILSNEKLRKLYNEFGLAAARSAATPELELVPYTDLAERFRSNSWNSRGGGGNDTGRDAYFTVANTIEPRVDATGLIVALEDGIDSLGPPLAAVTQVGLASSATAYVSQKDTIGVQYSLAGYGSRARGDGGVGDVELSWRRQLDSYSHVEATTQAPLEDLSVSTVGVKAFRALSKNMSMSWEATFRPIQGDLTSAISSARSFSERSSASVSWAVGTRSGYAFTWARNAYDEYVAESSARDEFGSAIDDDDLRRENGGFPWLVQKVRRLLEPAGLRWTARWSGMDASLSCTARRPIGEQTPLWERCEAMGPGGAHLRVSGLFGLMGWEVKAGVGQRFMLADTEIGTTIGFGTIGIVWRIKARRGAHRLNLPIVLQSGFVDTKSAFIGSLLWSATLSALQVFVVQPWQRSVEKKERAEAKTEREDILTQAQAEANATKELMKEQVGRVREAEKDVEMDGERGGGLLIERAVYGWRRNIKKMRFVDALVDDREIDFEVTEVTVPLQGLVDKSTLQIVSATKATLAGVWDPSAFGDKDEVVLRIWYLFRGEKHECTLRDDEVIELPLSSHRVTKWS